MLDPDYLEQAGERVASVYSQIEADMLDYLVGKMIEGDVSGQRAQTAINNLAQSSAGPLMEIVGKREREISAAVRIEVEEALRRSDEDDLARIKRGLGVDLPGIATRQIAATVAGAEAILARQNLLMAESARNAFLEQSVWAVTQVNSGAMTTEKALHAAVRRLERDGISLVTYRNATTGLQTVENKVDVAVRRHIRTQIAQDGMRLTETRMDQAGVDLVEVSSHGGARPSHAAWEGRVYSRNGDKTIDGVHYRDFKRACNWGDVADGIGGANCRHSYAAWFPGMERAYRPNPEHPSGKSNAEVYELTQRQRAGERAIRQTKRELRGAQQLYEATKSAESLGEVSRLKIRLRDQQEAVRSLVNDNPKVLKRSPRREWAGDMPKVKVPKASGRKVDDFLSGEAVGKTLKAKGASKKAAKEALAEAMKERGGTLRDFAALTASEQQRLFRDAMTRRMPTEREKRRASVKPVNDALYHSQKNYVERHGGLVLRGGDEVERHLDRSGADAACIGGIVMLREDATASEVLEEVFHFQQDQRGDYSGLDWETMFLRREIDAQRYLLSVSERYNIPKAETEQTKENLLHYEKRLDDIEKGAQADEGS